MCKRVCGLIFMPVAALLSMDTGAAELAQDHFKGMQLAWVFIPSPSAEGEPTTKKPKTTQPAASQPVHPAAISATHEAKPAPVPAVKSAPVLTPQPAPAIGPAQAPVAQPVPAAKTAPIIQAAPVVNPAQPHLQGKVKPFEWLIGIGVELGGEELGTVTYADGSTAPVKANSGIVLNVGSVIANGADSQFSTQLTVGYKSGGPKMWSGDVIWSAIPLEVIEQYHTRNMRIGLGISYQLNPQLKVSLPSSNFISKYNNAIGYIVQVSWAPATKNYSIGLRYTSIKFQSSDIADAPLINGNVGGLFASYYF